MPMTVISKYQLYYPSRNRPPQQSTTPIHYGSQMDYQGIIIINSAMGDWGGGVIARCLRIHVGEVARRCRVKVGTPVRLLTEGCARVYIAPYLHIHRGEAAMIDSHASALIGRGGQISLSRSCSDAQSAAHCTCARCICGEVEKT